MIDRIRLPRMGSTSHIVVRSLRSLLIMACANLSIAEQTRAQGGPDTAVIDTIRVQSTIGESDQRRISDWIEAQISRLKSTGESERPKAATQLRQLLKAQFDNSSNTPAFKEQITARAGAVLVAQLSAGADPVTLRTLVKTLLDFNRPEAMPAYLAGLKSKDAGVRMLSASGIASQRSAIVTDKAKLDQAIAALREAGLAETEGVVLDRIYWALSVPAAQAGSVVDTFFAIMDKRLAGKRAGAIACDGAEVSAFEFFRTPAVMGALQPPQKEKLARLAGEFMRFDATRYTTPNLTFNEVDRIQRGLDATEDVLAAVVGSGVKGGDVRGALASGASSADVLQQVRLWVGDSESKQPGALNAAPWNLPIESP